MYCSFDGADIWNAASRKRERKREREREREREKRRQTPEAITSHKTERTEPGERDNSEGSPSTVSL
jgi:hypothetical protein